MDNKLSGTAESFSRYGVSKDVLGDITTYNLRQTSHIPYDKKDNKNPSNTFEGKFLSTKICKYWLKSIYTIIFCSILSIVEMYVLYYTYNTYNTNTAYLYVVLCCIHHVTKIIYTAWIKLPTETAMFKLSKEDTNLCNLQIEIENRKGINVILCGFINLYGILLSIAMLHFNYNLYYTDLHYNLWIIFKVEIIAIWVIIGATFESSFGTGI